MATLSVTIDNLSYSNCTWFIPITIMSVYCALYCNVLYTHNYSHDGQFIRDGRLDVRSAYRLHLHTKPPPFHRIFVVRDLHAHLASACFAEKNQIHRDHIFVTRCGVVTVYNGNNLLFTRKCTHTRTRTQRGIWLAKTVPDTTNMYLVPVRIQT